MTPIIDVHSHIVPTTLPDAPAGLADLWPCMTCGGAHGTMTIGGKPYRDFDDRNWSTARRIEHMDGHAIGLQVLSPLPELLSYWFPADAGAEMCRHVNSATASMVAEAPDRFAGFAMAPLQDPGAATRLLESVQADGFVGVEIGSNIDGVSPADDRFIEFFSQAEALGLSVFVHGVRPSGIERMIGYEAMGAIVGVPMDTALCVASMLAKDFPVRFPSLRIAFSHGGGAIGSVLGRLRHVWSVMPGMRATMGDPAVGARRFFYDLMTFDADYARFLSGLVGVEQLLVGTDFPAGSMGLMDPGAFASTLGLTASDLAAVRAGNARRYLNIQGGPT